MPIFESVCSETVSVEILCLANSKKYSQHCVAGLRTDGGGWLRPVTLTGEGALSTEDITLPDGTQPRLLDVLRVCCSRPVPKPHQPENRLLAPGPWELVARPAPEARRLLEQNLSPGTPLLGDCRDRIAHCLFKYAPARASLVLIRPTHLEWEVRLTKNFHRQTRAKFRLGNAFYNLSVTDPAAALRLAASPPGLYTPAEAGYAAGDDLLFTVSLGEPTEWDHCCYKLVAGAIVLPSVTSANSLDSG